MKEQIFNITPVPKPRMTQRDKWLNPPRPCVQRYWDFKDQVKRAQVDLPTSGASILFKLPMPKSWSNKKKQRLNGGPHQSKPDLKNLLAALEDSLYQDDSKIWEYKGLVKLWAYEGSITIRRGKPCI